MYTLYFYKSDATIKIIQKRIPLLKNETTNYLFTDGIPISIIQYTTYGLNPNLIYTIVKYNNDYLIYTIDINSSSSVDIVDSIIFYI